MALRDMVGTAAKMTAGFWTEVARAVDPPRERPSPETQPGETASPDTTAPAAETSPAADDQVDGVLVPVDTWTRVMDQLGNLHEAGQQLAEARERAARAETQVEFLREQLAEARTKPRPRTRPPKADPVPAPEPAAAPSADSTPPTGRAQIRVRKARNRVSAWLRTD